MTCARCREPRAASAPTRVLVLTLALTALAGPSACVQAPGVALTFDDNFIDQWYGERARFERHGVRVTFAVSKFDRLDDTELGWLRALEDDGHEIACHSLTHVDPHVYLEDHTVADYMAAEIDPALARMRAEGFDPTAFTFPWDGRTDELEAALLEEFTMLRGSGYLHGDQDFFHHVGDGPLTAAARIDDGWWTVEQLDDALRQAERRGAVLVLYAHRILDDSDKSHITPDGLETVLARIEASGLPSYTLSELPDRRP